MNFYQELQLNQAGSKSYIASFKNPKDKCKHIAYGHIDLLCNY